MAQGKAAVLLMALLLLAVTGLLLGGGWTSGGMRVEGVFRYPKQLLCWLGILLVLGFVLLLCCF